MSDAALLTQVTPVLVVARVEPCVVFWKKLGYAVTAEVPHEDAVGFAMLGNGVTTIMYQSAASVAADLRASMSDARHWRSELQQNYLFVHVADLARVEAVLADEPLVMPRRKTFYGATETGYLDPAGNLVVFAQFG